MKTFVDDDDYLLFGEYQIYCIPTTDEEKEFINNSTDENGNIKPSVYDMLYKYKDEIVDNIFHGRYNGHYTDKFITSEIIKDEVERLRDKEEDKWTIKTLPIPKPSDLCLIDLFYAINNNSEMRDKIIKSCTNIWSKVKEEENDTSNKC